MTPRLESILAVPVFNSENLRGGHYIRFFIKRSATYPSRCSDLATSPELFVGPDPGDLPGFLVPPIKKKYRDRLASILNAEVAAFVLVWPACQYGLLPNYPNRMALQPLVDLVRWTIQTYIGAGEAFVATRLKLLSAWARYKAGPQLHAPPAAITRMPFCDANGVPEFDRIFVGSISSKAHSSKSLFRFSRMSRAFPPGDAAVATQAVREHRELMLSSPDVPAHVLGLFSDTIRRVTKDSLAGIERPGITLSNSSCWERTRRRGGAAEEITSTFLNRYPGATLMAYLPGDDLEAHIDACRLQGVDEDYDLAYGVEPEGLPHEIEPVITMAYRACVEEEFPSDITRRLAKHKVIPVPDRGGFKIRVITSGEARIQCLAHNVRKVIYRNVLPKTPSKWALVEKGVTQFLKQVRRPDSATADLMGDWVVLSCDMKSATDRFPHSVVETINDSLESNLSAEQRASANWTAWRMLSGPQLLRYPDSGEDEPLVETTCGNLMGTAPSWVHLNLFNLTLIRTAWSLWADSRTRRQLLPLLNKGKVCKITDLDLAKVSEKVDQILQSRPLNTFIFPREWKFNSMTCIVGDDLGAVCPFGVAVIYEVVLVICNGRTSFGKHYVQPWSDGSFMLLAEDWAIVNGNQLQFQLLESLRGIVAATHQYDNRKPQPAWCQIGSTLADSVSKVRPEARRAVCSLGHVALQSWRGYLLRLGLPIYLPLSIGGLGWPHPRGMEYAIRLVSTKSLLVYQVLRGFRSDPLAFAFEILKLRCSWLSTERSEAYIKLLRTLKSYFCGMPVSRDEFGALAPLTEDAPIGLEPTRWALLGDENRCRPLIDVIDQCVLAGLPVGYLCEVRAPDFEKPYLEATRAGKRYRKACDRLLKMRVGHLRPVASRSEYVSNIEADETLLKSLHIYMGPAFEEVFPHLAASIMDSLTTLVDHSGREE